MGREGAMGSEDAVAGNGVSVELTNKTPKTLVSFNSWRVSPETGAAAARLSRSDRLKSVCGVWKIFVSFTVLMVGGGHLYLHLSFYPMVPTFFLLAVFSMLLFVSFVYRAALVILSGEKTEENNRNHEDNGRFQRLFAFMNWVMERYDSICDVNGKYYLVRMALSEVSESALHCFNFFNILLCSLPLFYSSVVGIVVVFNTFINAFGNVAIKSMQQRNFHTSFDMVMDIVMSTLPLAIQWFILEMSTPVETAIQLILLPSVFFYSKANDIWSELHRVDMLRMRLALNAEENGRKIRRSRSRDSIHRHHQQMATIHAQVAHFPTWAQYLTVAVNVLIALSLIVALCFQFSNVLDNASCRKEHSSEVWNGCQVKLPFCKNPFSPTCDCSILKIENYSKSEFPPSINMFTHLAGLYVYSGLLKTLPREILKNVKEIIVVDNRLSSLPAALGESTFLLFIDLSNNELHGFPPSVVNLKSLTYLYAKNNTIENLPKHIGKLDRLLSVDLRNNRLNTIPDSVANLQHLRNLYLFGNPLCPRYNFPGPSRKLTGLCEKQCADGCRAHGLGNGFCHLRYKIYKQTSRDESNKMYTGCNVDSCDMDNGDCNY